MVNLYHCSVFEDESYFRNIGKITSRKEMILVRTPIKRFCADYYFPVILKLNTHLTHVQILCHLHCGLILHKYLKRRGLFRDAMSRSDFSEHLIDIFTEQIQSAHFVSNWSIYMEGIALEHF